MDQGSTDPIASLTEEVKKLQDIVSQNHILLLGVQRRSRFMFLGSILKWIVIIGISFGSFYFLQPFFETAMNTYKTIGSDSLHSLEDMMK